LADGYHKAFRTTVRLADGRGGRGMSFAVDLRVVGRERISVGDCTLDTLVVDERRTYTPDSIETRHMNFSPLLRTFVRITSSDGDEPPTTTVYDRIEPAGATR
jgi:hypothetical protein